MGGEGERVAEWFGAEVADTDRAEVSFRLQWAHRWCHGRGMTALGCSGQRGIRRLAELARPGAARNTDRRIVLWMKGKGGSSVGRAMRHPKGQESREPKFMGPRSAVHVPVSRCPGKLTSQDTFHPHHHPPSGRLKYTSTTSLLLPSCKISRNGTIPQSPLWHRVCSSGSESGERDLLRRAYKSGWTGFI